jgi:hypothetical protein
MPFVAVGKIRRVDQAERRRRQQFALLALARGGFDQFGRIPFAEIDFDAFGFEPALQEINLRGLARTVEALNGDQPPGKIQFRKSFHNSRRSRFFILAQAGVRNKRNLRAHGLKKSSQSKGDGRAARSC